MQRNIIQPDIGTGEKMSHKVPKVLQISEEVALEAASVFRSPSHILEYGVWHWHLQLCLDPDPQEQRKYVLGSFSTAPVCHG